MISSINSHPAFKGLTDGQPKTEQKQAVFVRDSKPPSATDAIPADQMRNWLRSKVGPGREVHADLPMQQENRVLARDIQRLFEATKENGASGHRRFNFLVNGTPAGINGTSHNQLINAAGGRQVDIHNGVAKITSGVRGDRELHDLLLAAKNALQRQVGS